MMDDYFFGMVAWCSFVWSLRQPMMDTYLLNTQTETHSGKYDVQTEYLQEINMLGVSNEVYRGSCP